MFDENQTIEIESDETAETRARVAPATWPRVINLKHPVQFGSEHITSLTFRRGRAGDIKGLKLGTTIPADQLITIASRLCGKPVPVIESLDVDDSAEVMALALDFYGKCLGGGSARSQ
jgi:hypothetical protein